MNKRPYISHVLEIRYADAVSVSQGIESQLRRLYDLLNRGCANDPLLNPARWLIATGERDSSTLYPAFDANGPTPAALAFIREENKGNVASKSFVLWNGEDAPTTGASVSCRFDRKDGRSSSLTLSMRSNPDQFRLGGAAEGLSLVQEAVKIFQPIYCNLSPDQYDAVFPDRPGAGWMLYLQSTLSTAQVPEARLLVPVSEGGPRGSQKQIGTILVSVTDQPFSDENPEHIAVANAIEIRLVDQDLLPKFSDL